MHDRAAQDEEGGVSYKLKFAELDILRKSSTYCILTIFISAFIILQISGFVNLKEKFGRFATCSADIEKYCRTSIYLSALKQ